MTGNAGKVLRFTVLLLIVMAFLLPCIPHAAAAQGDRIITEVRITMNVPADGEKADTSSAVCKAVSEGEEIGSVVFLSAEWCLLENGSKTPLTGTDTFEQGKTYQLCDAQLYLIGGYVFSDETKVTLNGKEIPSQPDGGMLTVTPDPVTVNYAVRFEMNGYGKDPAYSYDKDGKLVIDEIPEDPVYGFAGWYADKDLSVPFDFSKKITEPVTLWAKWIREIHTIEISVDEPKYYVEPYAMWPGYSLDGTHDNSTIKFQEYRSKDRNSWVKIFRTVEVLSNHYFRMDTTIRLDDPEVSRFAKDPEVVFIGADNALEKTYKIDGNVFTASVIFYYEEQFTVKFDMCGHGTQVPDKVLNAGDHLPVPETEPYAGEEWQFTGWYPDKNFSVPWRYNLDAVKGDMTLYAGWTRRYRVDVDMGGIRDNFSFYITPDEYLPYRPEIQEIKNQPGYYYRNMSLEKDRHVDVPSSITSDCTLYPSYYQLINYAVFEMELPQEGALPNNHVALIDSDPKGSMYIDEEGHWEWSLTKSDVTTPMKEGETFRAGRYYVYKTVEVKYTKDDYYWARRSELPIYVNYYKPYVFIYDNASSFGVEVYWPVPSTVCFDMQGHGEKIDSMKVNPSECVEIPEDPVCDGYRFTGWYTSSDLKEKYDFTKPVNDHMTLYAGWEEVIDEIDIDMTIPLLHCSAESSVKSIETNVRETPAATSILWRRSEDGTKWEKVSAGEDFLPGYYYRAEFTLVNNTGIPFSGNGIVTVLGSDDNTESTLDPSGNMKVIYTRFVDRKNYSITYEMNGKGEQIPAEYVEEGLYLTEPAKPTEDDYVFIGWFTDKECRSRMDFNRRISSDMILYAKWSRLIHEIDITTPALFAGKKAPDEIYLSTELGNEGLWYYTVEPEWEKEGSRIFDYWFWFGKFEIGGNYTIPRIAIPSDGGDYTFADDVVVRSNTGTVDILQKDGHYIEVRLKVTIKNSGMFTPGGENAPFTVVFSMNGHGEEIASQDVLDGDPAEKPDDPKEEGWIFGGWYTDQDLKEKYDFDSPVTKDTVLFAKWTKAEADPAGPQTGTANDMPLYIFVMIAGILVITAISANRRKRTEI